MVVRFCGSAVQYYRSFVTFTESLTLKYTELDSTDLLDKTLEYLRENIKPGICLICIENVEKEEAVRIQSIIISRNHSKGCISASIARISDLVLCEVLLYSALSVYAAMGEGQHC